MATQKFLDQAGLAVLWSLIGNGFIDNDELTTALSSYETIEDLERDYYNSDAIDTLIAQYYTKAEIDELIDDYYTKSETDTLLNAKVSRSISGSNGTALIENESDGGVIQFRNNDGIWSGVAVNDAGNGGLAAQIYAVDKNNGNIGTRINVTNNAIYYTKGQSTYTFTDDDELVTMKDIASLEGGMHYIGSTTLASGETVEEALARMDSDPQAGDIVIVETAEYIYNDNNSWDLIGDESLWATTAALANAVATLEAADTTLQANINNEATARANADTVLQENIDAEAAARANADSDLQSQIDNKTDLVVTGTNGTARVFNESDGGGSKFEHSDGTWSYVGVNDGGANGLTAQIYSVNASTLVGTRINVTSNAIYYTSGKSSYTQTTDEDEIATLGDIEEAMEEIEALTQAEIEEICQ